MSNAGRDSPAQRPLEIPVSSSPGSFRSRSISASVPRADATARLASPVPTYGTPPIGRTGTPRNGEDAGSGTVTPLPGATGSNVPGPGISALAAALSNSIGSSPPRFGTPPVRTLSPGPAGAQAAQSSTPTNYGSFDTRSQRFLQPGANGAYEDPEIVKRHLVQPSDAMSDDSGRRRASDSGKGKQPDVAGDGLDDEEFSSLRLQGGDITRPIYKWAEEASNKVKRSKSFSDPRPEPETEVLDINTIKVPGGFRRNFLRRAARSPSANPDYDDYAESGGR